MLSRPIENYQFSAAGPVVIDLCQVSAQVLDTKTELAYDLAASLRGRKERTNEHRDEHAGANLHQGCDQEYKHQRYAQCRLAKYKCAPR